MSTIFAILLLLVIIATIVGLIKPSLLQTKSTPNVNRKELLVGGVVLSLILVFLIGAFAPETTEKTVPDDQIKVKVSGDEQAIVIEPEEEKKIEPVQKVVAEPVIEANLGMTPEQFKTQFNARLKELNITTVQPLNKLQTTIGSVKDIFQVQFSNDIVLNGTVNKDGMLKGLTFIVIPKEDPEQAFMDSLILAGITTNVISGTKDQKKTSAIVVDLISKAMSRLDKDNNTQSKIVGDVKYFATASKITGLWFGVEPAKDE